MSSLGSPSPFFLAGKKGYEVKRSLRFNGADGPYLENTPSSHSNKRKMTFSFWFKRAVNTNFVSIFRAYGNASNRHSLDFVSGGSIRLWGNYNGSVAMTVQTTQLFRDFSAWYHFVLVLDTEQGTASNRAKMYVNGVQITDFSNSSYPSQNFDFGFNDQNAATQIGVPSDTGCNYYIAEFQEIDGLALDPSYFAETDAITGQWNPKKYTGSYGTNGFYLNFSDNSGTTATTLGKDSSGVGRNFTPNNFSVAAGAGNDSVEDTPTNNWCTLNPLDADANGTFSEGNLKCVGSTGFMAGSNFVVKSGKWYMEVKYVSGTSNHMWSIGFSSPDRSYKRQVRGGDGELTPNTGTVAATFADPDVIMVALDVDNGKWYIGKNGSYMLSGDPVNGTGFVHSGLSSSEGFMLCMINNTSAGSQTIAANFGQQGFTYTPPTGFKAFNSANLPDATIKKPNKHFDILLYSGNGGTQSITGLNFQPDWVWAKRRNGTNSNVLFDAVRGATKELISNSQNAEGTEATALTSFDSNGFSVGSNGGVNDGSGSYVAWNWNAGNADSKTYTVTVVNDSGNKYRFDGYGTSAVTLSLAKGGTYTFNYPSAHPLRFSTTSDGTHGGGSEYTSGVSTYGTSITITVAANAPTLYYYCSQHSGMGGQVNPTTTLGSSNFDGSTQSIVKVNPTAGFSMVGFTGTGSNATVGHGLGVAPSWYFVKERSSNSHWYIYSKAVGANKSFRLNENFAASTDAKWQNTDPTTSLFYLSTDTAINESSQTYIAYLFSEVEGYSKFGSYTGNGSSNGPFISTGFRPALFIQKRTDTSGNWYIFDNKRSGYNVDNDMLVPNDSDAEYDGQTYPRLDFVSNGIKWRDAGSSVHNASGGTYIYLAFAESPFKYARAR